MSRLRDRSSERVLWRRIRTEIRKSKRLWKEYRASKRRSRTNYVLNGLWLIWFPVIAFSLVSNLTFDAESQLLFVSVLSFAVTLASASNYFRKLFTSNDAAVLAHYPISDADFVVMQTKRVVRGAFVIAVITGVFYAWIGSSKSLDPFQWYACLLLCLMQWMLAACGAIILFCFRPLLPWGRIAFGVSVALAISLFTIQKFPLQTLGLWQIAKIWPAYWINHAFTAGVIKGNALLLLFPCALFLLVPFARRCVEMISANFHTGSYLFDYVVTAEQYHDLAEDAEADMAEEDEDTEEMEEGEDHIHDDAPVADPVLQVGILHDRMNAGKRGWIEAWVDRATNEREKVLINFLTGGTQSWTSHWKLSMVLTAVGLFGPLLAGYFSVGWILLIVAIVGIARGLPIGGGEWAGLAILNLGTVCQAPVSQYPVGYWETTRLMFKVNMLRIISLLPVFLTVPVVLCWSAGCPILQGLRISAVVMYAIAGFQVFVIGFKFYDKTSARNMKPAIALLGVPMMMFGLICGGSCIAAMILAPSWLLVLIAAAGYVLPGLIMWLWFGFLFNHRKTDLFYPIPRPFS